MIRHLFINYRTSNTYKRQLKFSFSPLLQKASEPKHDFPFSDVCKHPAQGRMRKAGEKLHQKELTSLSSFTRSAPFFYFTFALMKGKCPKCQVHWFPRKLLRHILVAKTSQLFHSYEGKFDSLFGNGSKQGKANMEYSLVFI